ncbi:reticulon isoform X2 [Lasioglossum baleicum]|uniref:reticulon isoform X2 n=1 Tax=Lasioglossum baleicum TaxID=434251 RepID=UPI003FCE31FA
MAELKEQPIRREHDSMDDFEHLEHVQDGQPAQIDSDQLEFLKKSPLETIGNVEGDLLTFSPVPPSSKPRDTKNATALLLDAEKGRSVLESEFEVRSKEPEEDPLMGIVVSEYRDPEQSEVIQPVISKKEDEILKEEMKYPLIDTIPSASYDSEIVSIAEKRSDDSWNVVEKPELVPEKPEPVLTKPDPVPETLQPLSSEGKKVDSAEECQFIHPDKKERTSAPETGESEFESEVEASPIKTFKPAKQEPRREVIEEMRTAPKEKFPRIGIVADLIYWRDPKKTGPVFAVILAVLLSLASFSLISVLAYVSLLALTGTVAFRIYRTVFQAIQKTSDGHPFKDILDLDLTVPAEKVHEVADVAVAHANAAVNELRRLFLVEDFVDSLKFGVFLWCLTYVGSWFNGLTLIILQVVSLFTLPKVYETNKAQIDQNLALVYGNINELTARVRAVIPLGKKEPVKEE